MPTYWQRGRRYGEALWFEKGVQRDGRKGLEKGERKDKERGRKG